MTVENPMVRTDWPGPRGRIIRCRTVATKQLLGWKAQPRIQQRGLGHRVIPRVAGDEGETMVPGGCCNE